MRGLAAATNKAKFDKVAGIEARGFIIGGALAQELGTGFVPVRKKGKLPAAKISEGYELRVWFGDTRDAQRCRGSWRENTAR